MNRDEILNAVKEASSLTREHVVESQPNVDLIAVVDALDIPVLYRPLNDMWGGAITIDGKSGIIIKERLPRYLQRFTLAHEIGHIVLGHEDQFDDEVGLNQRATGYSDRPVEEIAADTFASELLAPRKLIRGNAKRQDWSPKKLQNRECIYQLSLRLGISFEATCWALVEHDLLKQSHAKKYLARDGIVKEIKGSFTPYSVSHDPYADVWSLSQGDAGVTLEASEEDLFLIELEERSSSGYRWEAEGRDKTLEIIFDNNKFGEKYGSFSTRKIGIKFSFPGSHTITLNHKRPWNDDTIQELNFSIDNRGREEKGLPRRVKQATLTRAKA